MRTADLHLQRSTEALLGYLQGIACDDQLTNTEVANLQRWLETHHALRNEWPFATQEERKSVCIGRTWPAKFLSRVVASLAYRL